MLETNPSRLHQISFSFACFSPLTGDEGDEKSGEKLIIEKPIE